MSHYYSLNISRFILVTISLFVTSTIYSQIEKKKLSSPVQIPILLAGNFAELRPNHFHMGIDIKTQGKEGLEVFSVDEGWISRIKVSSFGYGKVLYIDHPNGTTSVYAHLQQFAPEIERLVRQNQKEQQSWEIELFFEKNQVQIKERQWVANSGNTGGSSAPHLHFEIRDTETEHAMNPLKNGIEIPDSRAPEFRNLKIYGVNNEGYLLPGKTKIYPIKKDKEGKLLINVDTIEINYNFFTEFGGIGFGIDATDKLNNSENVCGLYGATLLINDEPLFGHEMNRISFDHTRYINTHRDINESGKNMHKLFRNVTNPLDIYKNSSLGIVDYRSNTILNIEIIGYDELNNQTNIKFVVKFKPSEFAEDVFGNRTYYWPKDHQSINNEKYNFEILAGTFYEPTRVSKAKNTICDVNTSLQKAYNIALEGPSDPLSDKRYLAVSGSKAIPTTFKEGKYYGKTNVTGEIVLRLDTIPPSINWLSKGNILSTDQIKFSISDWGSGIKNYYFYINGEWVMLEYEYKTKQLFTRDKVVIPINSSIRLEVYDQLNNMAIYEQIINRQ